MSRGIFVFVLLAAFLLYAPRATADTPLPTSNATHTALPKPTRLPTPLPGGNMLPAWMTPPAPGPTQADAGAVLYFERCMACHGDRGQGLTVEWRAQWDVEHQDCARSTCHGAQHPPEGFSFPKNFAPALMGTNALTRFANAQELFDFIRARMPYQAPGTLTTDEYWALVAFVLRQRGVHVNVNAENASGIALQPARENAGATFGAMIAGGIFFAGAAIFFLRRARA
jgi:mono/diheme cytochrome c family protein